ncbi:MAG: histidinol phosphate phosphatase [Chitinivibrionales bacterium]|nr:histidinol phosphate phosphatase [Chitinivibrionales bacterium]
MTYNKELKIALDCSEEAGKLQLSAFSSLKNIEIKSDNSPVTQIDKQCEALIRRKLLENFPGDGFLGEETGLQDSGNGRRWIVDPIDGTRPYIHGIPTFSTLIGLEHNKQYVVGVIHFAGLKETYWASRGGGAYCNGTPIHVSNTSSVAHVFGSSLGYIEKSDTTAGQQLLSMMKQWDYSYGYMDAYSYASVAGGKLDACVNLMDKPWDCAAAACIIQEAGGEISDIHGNKTVENGTFVATNGRVHDDILAFFRDPKEVTF